MKYQLGVLAVALLSVILFFSACQSTRISQHYAHNRYLLLGESIAYNQDLPLYVPTYGDVVFERDARAIRRRLRNVVLPAGDSVLLYGYTSASPSYAFILTTGTGLSNGNDTGNAFVFKRDTCIGERHYSLLAMGEATERPSINKDATHIWERIAFDSLGAEQFGSIFSVTGQKTNKVYQVLDYIEQFPAWTDQERWNKTQLLLTYASFLGDHITYRDELAALEARMMPDSAIRAALANTAPVHGGEVLDSIASEARNRQVVMINENHFYPNHRTLVYDLLDTLKAVGFRYLALEALAPEQEEKVNRTRTIDLQTGFYIQEQQYARLLRKALALGYTLVAYENTDTAVEREAGQARNLYDKTLGRDPQARVLVLAGMDHILEEPTAQGKKWMAALFKETYGIDPLTIDQNNLKHLRHLAPTGYLLAKSNAFTEGRLTATDYQLVNNQPVAIRDQPRTRTYRNRHRDTVQVLLFATERPVHAVMAQEVPYYTTLVAAKSTVRLPVAADVPILLVVYDRYGNRVESRVW